MTVAVERLRAAVCCLVLLAVVFVQDGGLVVPDTKLDLTADPVGFLLRSLTLWDPQGGGGQLQNQAYGYLLPIGPVFVLLELAGIPDWVAQRLWQGTLLVVAFLGVRAFAARLGIGTPGTRLLAAAVYALSPRLLSQTGAISAEVWPTALAPWVLVPLVLHGGSPRRAAALSGVALALAGGTNGAATLALVPLGVLWLLVLPSGPLRRSLAGWWAVAVVCASAWWVGPLLLLGRYSPRFLDVIESASVTTAQTGLWPVLTGNDLWLQYLFTGPSAVRPAGSLLVTSPAVVLCATAVAAVGLAGVLHRRVPHRAFLAGAVLLGLVVVTAGHVGALTGPAAPLVRDLLDGPLAAVRNVHKFDLLLRLPLALGVAHAAALVRRDAVPGPVGPALRRPLAMLAGIALLGTAAPAVPLLQPPGAYVALPSWWRETADFLDARAAEADGPSGRALVVPAAQFSESGWGRTLDDPLQPLLESSFVVRDAVPFGGPGVTRVLDVVSEVLQSGTGSPVLAAYLQRSGVRHLVVRNDLDPERSGALRPLVLHAALQGSPGLRRVAAFGPLVGVPPQEGPAVVDGGLSQAYPAVEVFEVLGAGGPDTVVAAVPRRGTQRVSGGPESVLPLLASSVLAPGQAARLAGEPALPGDERELRTLTDGYRDREVSVGRAFDSASATLGSGTAPQADRPVHDYLPVPEDGARTVVDLHGVEAVSASSSAADAGAILARGRDHHPAAAVDGDPATSWVTGGLDPAGQWVEVGLGRPRRLRAVVLSAARLRDVAVRVERVRVEAGGQVREVDLPASGAARVELGVTADRVRVTLVGVAQDGAATPFGVATLEVGLEGPAGPIALQRGLRLADDSAASTGGRAALPPVTAVLTAGSRDRSGCVVDGRRPRCSAALPLGDEDDAAIDRTFVLDRDALLVTSVTARPRGGPALDALLQQGQAVTATASSTAVDDPRARPATVLDRDVRTGWVAAADDLRPELRLAWEGAARIEGVAVLRDPTLAAARPTSVVVDAEGAPPQAVALDEDGQARLPRPVVTTGLALTFPDDEPRLSLRTDGLVEPLAVGVSEVRLLGPDAARLRQRVDPDAVVDLPCGSAPALQVDGRDAVTTSLRTTAGALLALQPVALTPCQPSAGQPSAGQPTTGQPSAGQPSAGQPSAGQATLGLSAGGHRVRVARDALLQPVQVVLNDLARPGPPGGPPRRVEVRDWGSTERRVSLGPGPESWLVVRENANDGWVAELDGERLQPARLDGWQQAFVVPAGRGGEVALTFGPNRLYRVALAVGALLLVVLALLAAVPDRTPRLPASPSGPRILRARLPGLLAGALAVPFLGGLAGAVALLVTAVVAAGLRGRARTAAPAVAAGALMVAGLLVALRPWPDPTLLSWPVQALGLVVAAVLAVSLAGPGAAGAAPDVPPGPARASPPGPTPAPPPPSRAAPGR